MDKTMYDLSLKKKSRWKESVVREREEERGRRRRRRGGRRREEEREREREKEKERNGHSLRYREPYVQRHERVLCVWMSCGCLGVARVKGACGKIIRK